MDQITQDLRQLENRITRYVFRYYIKPKHPELLFTEFRQSISQSLRNPTPSQKEIIIETLYDLKLADELLDESEEESDQKSNTDSSSQSNLKKKKELDDELSEYGLADRSSIPDMSVTELRSVPDEERCNFICLKKNKMYRCRNKQTEMSECCFLHEEEENTLLGSYLALMKSYPETKEIL